MKFDLEVRLGAAAESQAGKTSEDEKTRRRLRDDRSTRDRRPRATIERSLSVGLVAVSRGLARGVAAGERHARDVLPLVGRGARVECEECQLERWPVARLIG